MANKRRTKKTKGNRPPRRWSNITSSLSGKRYELLDILRPDFAKLLELCVRLGKIAVLNDYDGFEFGKSLANDVLLAVQA